MSSISDTSLIDNIVERMLDDLSLVGESRGYSLEGWRFAIEHAQGSQIADAWFDYARNAQILQRGID